MNFEESDAVFWLKQQKRREKRLGQPCCTQSGISWSMMHIPGKFAVVVHGEKDCLNCFHHHTGVSSVRFYSTRLNDAQLTMGTTEEVLRECLILIAKEEKPDVILVLGTCPVEVIGANFKDTVLDVSQETGVPMIPLKTSGLRLSSQPEMLDWLYEVLASLEQEPRVKNDGSKGHQKLRILWKREFGVLLGDKYPEAAFSVNLFGIPSSRKAELRWIFSFLGIHTLSFPEEASLSSWKQIGAAQATFLTDTSIFPRFLKKITDYNQSSIEIPVPIGLVNNQELVLRIAKSCGRETEARELLNQIVPTLEKQLLKIQKQLASKHFALVLRMRNTVQLEAIAQQGLGLIPFLIELGADLTLYIQGAPDSEVEEAYRQILQGKGILCPFHIFSSPFSLARMLKQQEYDLVLIPDQGVQAVTRAGLNYLDFGDLEAGFSALRKNWKRILEAMR